MLISVRIVLKLKMLNYCPVVKETFNKQLLDEVLVISRIIKVEVSIISRSRRLRLIILTETLIVLDIILYIERKKIVTTITDGREHKTCELNMITLRNHALRQKLLTTVIHVHDLITRDPR